MSGVTVFVRLDEGYYDDGVLVFQGLLTRNQIEEIGRKLGGVGDGGYERIAIKQIENEFYVSYCRDNIDPTKTEYGESYDEDTPGWGTTSYHVKHCQFSDPQNIKRDG